MTVIPAPFAKVFVVAAGAIAAIVVGAAVLGALVPQKLLVGTALGIFLLKSQICERTRDELGGVAGAVVVAGSAWGFGAWCSFDDFSLWPGLVATAVVAALAVGASAMPEFLRYLNRRLTPVISFMALLMVLSWFLSPKGAMGIAIAALFFCWSTVRFLIQIVDGYDAADPIGAGAGIVDKLSFVAWNAFILWARLAPEGHVLSLVAPFSG